MASRGLLIDEEHLPMEVAPGLDDNRAEDALPEVIWIADDDEGQLPIYISSDEDEDGEVVTGFAVAGGGIPPLVFEDEDEDEVEVEEDDEEQESDEEEEDEDTDDDDDDDWSDSFSEDSGYDSMYEEEEELEDQDDDDIRPLSPLNQPFEPGLFCQGWQQEYPSFPVPFGVPGGLPCAPVCLPHLDWFPVPQVEPPEEGLQPGSPRSEESAPSTSGLGSSTKRSREESYTEQVSTKRQRRNSEENHEEPAPSTSGLGPSTNRSREDSSRDSAPSTSGPGPATNRTYWQGPFGFPWWVDDNDSD